MPRVLYHLPAVRAAADRGGLVFVVEGEKDADAATALGLTATTDGEGAGKGSTTWRAEYAAALDGAAVVIVPDNDEPGRAHGVRVAAALSARGKARSVRVLELPGVPASGGDLSDWLTTRHAAGSPDPGAELLELVEVAAVDSGEWLKRHAAAGLPVIRLSDREKDVADQVLAALCSAASNLYTRDGRLVHVTARGTRGSVVAEGTPRIALVSTSRARELITEHVRLVNESGRPAHPPDWLPKGILSRCEWPGLPPLRGIVEGPTIRADGSILQTPGYDRATGLLYVADGSTFEAVPEAPTLEDARRAADELLELVNDFPFEGPEHRSAWLAALLSLVGRETINGVVPLILVDASTPGSGKGLLVDVAAVIATGREAARSAWPDQPAEREKTIGALIREGASIVCFDNVTGALGGSALDRLLTARWWVNRLLGVLEMHEGENRALWVATSNNAELGGDTVRRTVLVRLVPREERPELRDRFRFPALLDEVRRRRGRLLPAALMILRAFLRARPVAGRDLGALIQEQSRAGLPPFGSFEVWSVVIRGAVTWLGLADPAATREALQARATTENEERPGLLSRLAAWQAAAGKFDFGVADLVGELRSAQGAKAADAAELAALLAAATHSGVGELPGPRRIGKLFARLADRNYGGLRIVKRSPEAAHAVRWRVESAVLKQATPAVLAVSAVSSLDPLATLGAEPDGRACPSGASEPRNRRNR